MKTPKKLLYSLFTLLSVVIVGQVEADTLVPTKINDLKIECQGIIKVLSTEKSYYRPNWGTRVGPQAGAQAVLQVVELIGVGCTQLQEKYGLDMEKEIATSLTFPINFLNNEVIINDFSLREAPCLRTRLGCQGELDLNFKHPVHQAANKLVGKLFPFTIQQSFNLATKNGYLPFFNKVHHEVIHIGGEGNGLKLGEFSGNVSFQVNTQKVYQLPRIKQLSDKEKVLLISKLPRIIANEYKENQYKAKNFVQLMLDLNPSNPFIMGEYFDALLALFQKGPLDAWKVGGFHEAETLVSNALKKLSHHKEVEEGQVLDYLLTIPKTISSSFSHSNCVNLTEEILEDYLLDVLDTVTVGISKPAVGTKDAVKYFLQGNFCKYPLSESSKDLAKSLLNLLP